MLPDLTEYDAVLFDLDGVLTPTSDVHMQAWRETFEKLFADGNVAPPYSDDDYYRHLDGKRRYDGVASLLRSRNLEVPWGEPSDPPSASTVCGIGNRKNEVFADLLRAHGIRPYPGSLKLVDVLEGAGIPLAVVSSSRNAGEVLDAAGIRDRFAVVVDGVVADEQHLRSKPAPDMFVAAAEELGADPARTAVLEDAVSGVAAGAAGGFRVVIGVDRGAGAGALTDAGATVVVTDLAELVEL